MRFSSSYSIFLALPGTLLLCSSPTLGAPIPTDDDAMLQHIERDLPHVRFGMAVAAARGGLALPSFSLAGRGVAPSNEIAAREVTDRAEPSSFIKLPRDLPVGHFFSNTHCRVYDKSAAIRSTCSFHPRRAPWTGDGSA